MMLMRHQTLKTNTQKNTQINKTKQKIYNKNQQGLSVFELETQKDSFDLAKLMLRFLCEHCCKYMELENWPKATLEIKKENISFCFGLQAVMSVGRS